MLSGCSQRVIDILAVQATIGDEPIERVCGAIELIVPSAFAGGNEQRQLAFHGTPAVLIGVRWPGRRELPGHRAGGSSKSTSHWARARAAGRAGSDRRPSVGLPGLDRRHERVAAVPRASKPGPSRRRCCGLAALGPGKESLPAAGRSGPLLAVASQASGRERARTRPARVRRPCRYRHRAPAHRIPAQLRTAQLSAAHAPAMSASARARQSHP